MRDITTARLLAIITLSMIQGACWIVLLMALYEVLKRYPVLAAVFGTAAVILAPLAWRATLGG